MSWKVKRGNTSIQDILVKDRDGDAVANLASATEIIFHVKSTETGAAVIERKKTLGDIVVDTPSSGYIRITLTPTNTTQTVGKYLMAIEITWSATSKYECRIYIDNKETKTFEIEQDIVNT